MGSFQNNVKDLSRPHKLSYLKVPAKTPFIHKTIGQLVDEAAVKYSDLEAIVDIPQGKRLTYADFKQEVDQLAAGILAIGIHPGDRLGIWGPTIYQWLTMEAAAAKAGVIGVLINPGVQSKELEFCINTTGIKALAFANGFKSQNYYEIIREVIPEISYQINFKSQACPKLKYLISLENFKAGSLCTYSELCVFGDTPDACKELRLVECEVQVHDTASIYFTSGTTGNPKGAALSHYAIVNNSFIVGKRLECTEKDKVCATLLLCHVFGMTVQTKLALHFGCSLVIPSRTFNSSDVIKAIIEEKCTVMHGVPTIFLDIIRNPVLANNPITTLRIAGLGGATVSEQLLRDVKIHCNVKTVTGNYGMTEIIALTNNLPEDNDHLRTTTVGYPLENVEVKIVSKEGDVVPLGDQGELCVKGYNVMQGYWNDSVKTKEAFDEGVWFHTGDSGVMLNSGHIKIVARIKDIIIRGGENIAPQEIANVLLTHPEIKDAQVLGYPDERLGEVVACYVLLKNRNSCSAEDIKEFCRGKLSNFKLPQKVFFMHHFPRTVSGKINTFLLKQLAE